MRMLSPCLCGFEVANMLRCDGQFGLCDFHHMRDFVDAVLHRNGRHHNACDGTCQINSVLFNAVGQLHDQDVVFAQALRA